MQVDEEARVSPPKMVRIRVYSNARDWGHIEEVNFPPASDGSISLATLESGLNVRGRIRVRGQRHILGRNDATSLPSFVEVINPKNFRPMFEYTPGVLEAHDLQDLLHDGYVRVIGEFMSPDECWHALSNIQVEQIKTKRHG